MNAEPPTARLQMVHQSRRPGYACRSASEARMRFVAATDPEGASLRDELAYRAMDTRSWPTTIGHGCSTERHSHCIGFYS